MRGPHLSVGCVIFRPFAAEEEDENTDNGYDCDAADGASDNGADGGG
jgi:hypothetical protein